MHIFKMAIGGSIINLDMPERDADNGSWVAGTPAAYFSQESKDAVERLLYDRIPIPLTEEVFSVLGIRPFGHPALHRSRLRPVQELPGAFSRKALFFSATLMNWISAYDGVEVDQATAALPDAKGPEGALSPETGGTIPREKGPYETFSI